MALTGGEVMDFSGLAIKASEFQDADGTVLLDTITSTDNAVAKFNGTAGVVQNTDVLISDTNVISGCAGITPTPQELTASGAVVAGTQCVELNHASVIVAATIADAANHTGLFIVKDTSATGTAAHTLTLTSGTFDGTNNTATLNALNEALVVYFDSAGNGTIVENVGSVVLSSV